MSESRLPLAGRVLLASTLLISVVASLANPNYGVAPWLLPFRKAIKLIDPALVIVLAGFACAAWVRRGRGVIESWKALSVGCATVLAVVGCLSTLWWQTPPYFAAQSLFFVLRPALVLVVLCSWPGWSAHRIWTPVIVFGAANALTVFGQWAALARAGRGDAADAIIGLLNDAHQQATFSYTLALLLIGLPASSGRAVVRLGRPILIGACLAAGFISQGQKATGVLAVMLILAGITRVLSSRRRVRRVLAVVPTAAAVLLLVSSLAVGTLFWRATSQTVAGNLSDRLSQGGYRGLDVIGDIGAIAMVKDFVLVARDEPLVFLVGLGPASYGSPAALTRYAAGDMPVRLRDVFFRETMNETELAKAGELRLLGLSARTGVFGVVLGEFGMLGLLCFLAVTALPFLARGQTVDDRRFLFWLKWAYVGVIVQSALSTLGAWDNDVVMTMIMVGFAGHLSRESSS